MIFCLLTLSSSMENQIFRNNVNRSKKTKNRLNCAYNWTLVDNRRRLKIWSCKTTKHYNVIKGASNRIGANDVSYFPSKTFKTIKFQSINSYEVNWNESLSFQRSDTPNAWATTTRTRVKWLYTTLQPSWDVWPIPTGGQNASHFKGKGSPSSTTFSLASFFSCAVLEQLENSPIAKAFNIIGNYSSLPRAVTVFPHC